VGTGMKEKKSQGKNKPCFGEPPYVLVSGWQGPYNCGNWSERKKLQSEK
jgi:hypothetical protein